MVRSDGDWNLNNRAEEGDNFIQDGKLPVKLNLNADGSNSIILIALDEIGYFFLNGQFISQLDERIKEMVVELSKENQ